MRVLVAAFGNELRGDDGFGIAVLKRLQSSSPIGADGDDVRLVEVGTGGVWLAQELLSPCDRLIIVDAVHRNSEPGTVHVLKVEDVPEMLAPDLHLTVPSRALGLAKAMGTLPREVYLVGCEPAHVDELTMELSAPVDAAIARAARHVVALIAAGLPEDRR